jgi:hypothetical protein
MLRFRYDRSSALLVALLSFVVVSVAVGAFSESGSGNATQVTPESWDADIFHLPPSGKCIVHECEGPSDCESSPIDWIDASCLAFASLIPSPLF